MKKLISAILLIIIVSIVPVYASDIDLASMETADLISLRESIEQELGARNESENIASIGGGVFIAGEDIKSGNYMIVLGKSEEDDSGYFVVKTYDDKDSFENSESTMSVFLQKGQKVSLNLKDGNVLELISINRESGCFIYKNESALFMN